MYGLFIWNLTNEDNNKWSVSWRGTITLTWKLQVNTHCNIVSAVSGRWPLYASCYILVNFPLICINSSWEIVKKVNEYALNGGLTLTRLASNLIIVGLKYDLVNKSVTNEDAYIFLMLFFLTKCRVKSNIDG